MKGKPLTNGRVRIIGILTATMGLAVAVLTVAGAPAGLVGLTASVALASAALSLLIIARRLDGSARTPEVAS